MATRNLCRCFALLALTVLAVSLEIGDPVCTEGYIMDFFCIERGTLLDNPTVRTLENPKTHSVHCLVDVQRCVRSGYEVLIDPPVNETPPSPPYKRGFRLDDTGNAMVVQLARDSGICSTCNNRLGFDISNGFRATVQGHISELGDSTIPATIAVTNVNDSSVGCGDALTVVTNPVTGVGAGSSMPFILSHGILMLIGWGLLLPAGVISAALLTHRPNGLVFKIHLSLQIVGLLCAIPGWIVAIVKFNVFADPGSSAYYHGCIGMTVMTLGILQPINAFLRPHLPEAGEKKSSLRVVWEYIHISLGYAAIFLAVAAIGIGTTILPQVKHQRSFQIAYGLILVFLVLVLVPLMLWNQHASQLKNSLEAFFEWFSPF